MIYVPNDEGENYICKNCSRDISAVTAQVDAIDLPQTELSTHIQSRIDDFLKNRDVSSIIVRNISSLKKTTVMLPKTRDWLESKHKKIKQYQFRSKNIFVFQKHDTDYVCIFGMYSQEYSNCRPPNNGQVYISYLDSVNYFQPRELRSELYNRIVLAYIEYVKKMGYENIYLWSCPPTGGTDYMFHRHPDNQKVPSQTHLNRWYRNIFEKGLNGIVLKYTDLHSVIENITDIGQLPYFDGDFLPDTLENLLIRTEGKNLSESDILSMLFKIIKKYRNNFFVVTINQRPNVIHDPDPLRSCFILDNRGNFLSYAYENSLEFSSLRRAKYATSFFLKNLFSSGWTFVCKMCNQVSENAFQCADCIKIDR